MLQSVHKNCAEGFLLQAQPQYLRRPVQAKAGTSLVRLQARSFCHRNSVASW